MKTKHTLGVPMMLEISDPRLREAGLNRAAELKEWIAQRYEDAVAAAATNANAARIGGFEFLSFF